MATESADLGLTSPDSATTVRQMVPNRSLKIFELSTGSLRYNLRERVEMVDAPELDTQGLRVLKDKFKSIAFVKCVKKKKLFCMCLISTDDTCMDERNQSFN